MASLGVTSAEIAITGVAQTWDDVTYAIEFRINRGGDDRHVGVCLLQRLDPGRTSQHADELQSGRAGSAAE